MPKIVFAEKGNQSLTNEEINKLIALGILNKVEVSFDDERLVNVFGKDFNLLNMKYFIMNGNICFNTLFKEETA